jgi:hypothetical protein
MSVISGIKFIHSTFLSNLEYNHWTSSIVIPAGGFSEVAISFHKEHVNAPLVVVSMQSNIETNDAIVVSTNDITASGFNIVFFNAGTASTSGDYTAVWFSIEPYN